MLARPIEDLLGSAFLVAADRVRSFGRIVFLSLLMLGVGSGLAWPVAAVGVNDVPASLRVLVLVLWLLVLAVFIRLLTEERLRKWALERLMRDGDYGWLVPLLLAVVIFLFAATGFAAVTQLLWESGVVNLRKPGCAGCALDLDDFFNFYTWHFLEAIPLLTINDTLKWKEPLAYEGAGPGWLVLGLQISVILPLIQTIRSWWQLRSGMPRLRVDARPRVVRAGGPVTVSWAPAAPPSGYVFDVYLAPPGDAGDPRTALANAVASVVQQVVAPGQPSEATEAAVDGSLGGSDLRMLWVGAVRDRLREEGQVQAAETLTDEDIIEAVEAHLVAGPGWLLWQPGITERSQSFEPPAKGRYRFQARWRKATEAHADASKTPRAVAVIVRSPRTGRERAPDEPV